MSTIPAACWRGTRLTQRPACSASRSSHCRIRRAEDIAPAFEALKGRAEALYVVGDPLVNANRLRINTLALGRAICRRCYEHREYVEAGGLMSYGANFPDLYRRAADYVDKILRGAKPADIPVEQPTKFDLVINLDHREGARPRRPADAARPRRRGDRMSSRREFITLLGGAAVGWPLAAPAQQPSIPVVGFLTSLGQNERPNLIDAFRHGLSEVGFVEGRNVAIEYRFSESHPDRPSPMQLSSPCWQTRTYLNRGE